MSAATDLTDAAITAAPMSGVCVRCDEPIRPGELVALDDAAEWVCVVCVDASVAL